MAGQAWQITIDACVLFKRLERIVFTELLISGVISGELTENIVEELRVNLYDEYQMPWEKIDAVIDAIKQAYSVSPDQSLRKYPWFEYESDKARKMVRDKNDYHILRIAVDSNSEFIITENIRDFHRKYIYRRRKFGRAKPIARAIRTVTTDDWLTARLKSKLDTYMHVKIMETVSYSAYILKMTDMGDFLRELKDDKRWGLTQLGGALLDKADRMQIMLDELRES